MTGWVWLICAILLEVAGTTCMKLSEGQKNVLPTILMYVFFGACFFCFSHAVTQVPLGIAYAVWGGMGTSVIVLISMFYFKEPVTAQKAIYIGVIVLCVIGLRLTETETGTAPPSQSAPGDGEKTESSLPRATEEGNRS
jgi:small multidrug resistance pump